MSGIRLSVRAISFVLIGNLSGVIPAIAAPPLVLLHHNLFRIAALPSDAPEPGTPAGQEAQRPDPPQWVPDSQLIAAIPKPAKQSDVSASGLVEPTPNKRHISHWVWIAVVAGAGAGIGAGVLAGNHQSTKTAAVTPGATIGAGSGGITAGAPH